MNFLAVVALFFAGVFAIPTDKCGNCPAECCPSNPPSNPPWGGNPPANPPSNPPWGGNPPANPPSNPPWGGNPPANPPANPPSGGGGDYEPCPDGLFSNAECCDVSLLGLASLNCDSPDKTPTSAKNFKNICAKKGQSPRCCVLPVAGQAVLCEKPVGVS